MYNAIIDITSNYCLNGKKYKTIGPDIHKGTITIGLSVSLKTKIVGENTLNNRNKA